jgi:hypothetical protein
VRFVLHDQARFRYAVDPAHNGLNAANLHGLCEIFWLPGTDHAVINAKPADALGEIADQFLAMRKDQHTLTAISCALNHHCDGCALSSASRHYGKDASMAIAHGLPQVF